MSNVLLAPGTVDVRIALDPVHNNLASLYMIALADTYPGYNEWVERVAAGLSGAQRRTHQLLFDVRDQQPTQFPDSPAVCFRKFDPRCLL